MTYNPALSPGQGQAHQQSHSDGGTWNPECSLGVTPQCRQVGVGRGLRSCCTPEIACAWRTLLECTSICGILCQENTPIHKKMCPGIFAFFPRQLRIVPFLGPNFSPRPNFLSNFCLFFIQRIAYFLKKRVYLPGGVQLGFMSLFVFFFAV